MYAMTLTSSVFLLAARRAKSGNITLLEVLVGAAVTVIVLVVLAAHNANQNEKRKKMQEQIDDSHRLYYQKWHNLVAQTGTIAPVASPLLLGSGEECLRIENNVTLYEVRSVRHSTHTFGSVPIGKTRIRVGGGHTVSESTDEWRPIAEGQLYITNKQIYFDGDKQDRKIPLRKISTIKADWSAIEVSSETRQKSMVFSGVNGKVCQEIVFAATGQNVF